MKKIIMLTCMALFFPTFILFAQPEGRFEQRENRAVKILKLTEEQEKKFEAIQEQYKKNMLDVRATIQKNQIDLKRMVDGGTVDEKLLVKLTDENSKLQGEMKSMAVKRWIEVNALLDKDQKETWAKMLSRVIMMKENMKGRMRDAMMYNRHMRGRDKDKGAW